MKNDAFMADIGFDKMSFAAKFVAFLKITILLPLLILWSVLKYLFNPKKSILRAFKKAVLLPLLEFLTGKKTSDKILSDYTNIHHAILKQKHTFDEALKLNFEAHNDILTNSKFANIVMIILVLFIYAVAIELISLFRDGFLVAAIADAAWDDSKGTVTILSALSYLFLAVKIYLVVAAFSVEYALLKALFVTKKEDIKDYIDTSIFYADLKNREVYGDEHADIVKKAMYEGYLTQKDEVNIIDAETVELVMKNDIKMIGRKKDENSSIE